MKKWEYCHYGVYNTLEPGVLTRYLDTLGSDEWELITVVKQHNGAIFIFKREVVDDPSP